MIEARAPLSPAAAHSCSGCRGKKGAPIATLVSIGDFDNLGVTFAICEECGRDLANAIGFMCIRDGGWSKLEPKKRTSQAARSRK